jgi:phosphinothricin acetyltransferase
VLIRPAYPARDGALCAAIYAPFVRDTAVSFEENPPDADEMSARIAAVSMKYPWLVAQRGNELAGYAYATEHRSRGAYRWAADVAVYVDAAHRRRGVGRALYRRLLELLARQGIHTACAGITLPNQASVALHESLEFELVGVYRRIGYKAGAWRDVGWWQRALLPPGDRARGETPPPPRGGG